MKLRIKRKQNIDESNTMSSGNIEGVTGPFGSQEDIESFNKKQAKEQRLKGRRLAEMFSSRGISGIGGPLPVTPEEEFAGLKDGAEAQGLQNIKEANDETVDMAAEAPEDSEGSAIGIIVQKYGDKIAKTVSDRGLDVIKELGAGKFGTVYEVHKYGYPYALKVVGPSPNWNQVNWQQREKRNYEIVGKARHKDPLIAKHFPKVFKIWEAEGNVMILMEFLMPVQNPDAVFIPDKVNLTSRNQKNKVGVGQMPKRPGYHDQSKKAGAYFGSSFMKYMSGFGTKLENKINKDFPPENGELNDFDQILISISPSSLLHLKMMSPENLEEKREIYFDSITSWFNELPSTANALMIIDQETKGEPYFVVALSMLAMAAIQMISANDQNVEGAIVDSFVIEILDRITKDYRQFSAFKTGYSQRDVGKEENPLSSEWNATFKALNDLTNLLPKDMHHGNVMQRENGDLIIVDLGLFREESEPGFKMVEAKTRKIRINSLQNPKK